MKITDFDLYCDLLKEKSGLILNQDQSYILDSRLNVVAKKWGYASLDSMTIALQGVPDNGLVTDVIEAMMATETSFFHDIELFNGFRDTALRYMGKARARKTMKIWCAASSSGQEAYSVAMLMKDHAPAAKVEILSTDLSSEVLAQAREGVYSQLEVQRGLPVKLLLSHFTQEGTSWRVNADIQKLVRFDVHNLLEPLDTKTPFDMIFCCNVLDSFEPKTQQQILGRLEKNLAKDGFLFLETQSPAAEAYGLAHLPHAPGVYVSAGSPHTKAA